MVKKAGKSVNVNCESLLSLQEYCDKSTKISVNNFRERSLKKFLFKKVLFPIITHCNLKKEIISSESNNLKLQAIF